MVKNIWVLTVIVVLNVCLCNAQTSTLEDKKGETSIFIRDKNPLVFNSADASISFTFSLAQSGTYAWFAGLTGKLKSTEGLSKLLEGTKFNPGIEYSGFFGTYFGNAQDKYSFWYLSGKGVEAKYNILTQDTFNNFRKERFSSGSIGLGVNHLTSTKFLRSNDINSSLLMGIEVRYGLFNNTGELKTVDLYTSNTTMHEGQTTTILYDKKSGFRGDYFTFHAFKINADIYVFPQVIGNNIGVGGYIRSQLSKVLSQTNLGAGLVFGNPKAPARVAVSVLYQFNDVFSQLPSDKGLIDRSGINLVAGYKF